MPTKEIEEHVLVCARTLYEDTDIATSTIAQLMGVAPSTLARRAIANGWTPRAGLRLRRHIEAEPKADLAALGTRIRARLEHTLAEAERQLDRPGPRAARLENSERAARVLAHMTKTLNELKRLEAAGPESPLKADDDDIDVEQYRREIARRLDLLCAEDGIS